MKNKGFWLGVSIPKKSTFLAGCAGARNRFGFWKELRHTSLIGVPPLRGIHALQVPDPVGNFVCFEKMA